MSIVTRRSKNIRGRFGRILGLAGLWILALFLGYTAIAIILQSSKLMVAVLSLDESAVALDAKVVRIDSEVITKSDTNRRVTVSLPVMRFEYRGESFEFTAQGLPGDSHFTEGEVVTVVFPEGAPRQTVLSEYRNHAWGVHMTVGLFLLFGACVVLYALYLVHTD